MVEFWLESINNDNDVYVHNGCHSYLVPSANRICIDVIGSDVSTVTVTGTTDGEGVFPSERTSGVKLQEIIIEWFRYYLLIEFSYYLIIEWF